MAREARARCLRTQEVKPCRGAPPRATPGSPALEPKDSSLSLLCHLAPPAAWPRPLALPLAPPRHNLGAPKGGGAPGRGKEEGVLGRGSGAGQLEAQ